MRRIQSSAELLSEHFPVAGMIVLDVGCGTGELVRWLAGQGALVTGIDTAKMIERAVKTPPAGGEKYIVGCAEALPLPDSSMDLILYIASFHHVPENKQLCALEECCRVLKSNCRALFIEPISQPDSYYQITRLIEDEAEIQAEAYRVLQGAGRTGLEMKSEEIFFFARSFTDYLGLVDVFVEEDWRKAEVTAQAKEVTRQLCADTKISFEDYRYRSICRALLLEKAGVQ